MSNDSNNSRGHDREHYQAPQYNNGTTQATAGTRVPQDLLDDRNHHAHDARSSRINGNTQPEEGLESHSNYVSMERTDVPYGNGGNDDHSQAAAFPHTQAGLAKGNTGGDDDDDHTIAKSVVSSVLTADGIHDFSGFLCVCLVILVGDMSRGVMFPSMWPLVESLGGTEVTLGYSVAAFSFGRVMVNPIFGSWSHQIGYTKTLFIACTILLFGTLVYAQVQNVGKPQFLIVAQTILGIGSGTLGVTRAFVADVTAKRNRTTYMAWITAVQYAGFTVTPVFGALFNHLFDGGEKNYQLGILRLNMYTAPAYFMSLTVLFTLVMLSIYFRDRQRIEIRKDAAASKKSARRQNIDAVSNSTTFIGLTVYDCCILGCMLLNVSTKGSIASFETLGIAIAQSNFNLLASQAGATVAACGAIGVFALLSMGYMQQHLNDIQLISGGMITMAAGIASLGTISGDPDNAFWRYTIAIFLIYGLGYPIGHTAVIGLFSKIVGRRPQGTLLGWFASAGSIARMFFPVMSGYVANIANVQTLFFILTGVLALSTIFVLKARQTLSLLSS